MKNQKGFTLIELVMVILLLGILAAVAIPRFWDLGGKADEAAANGGLGGIKSGLSIYYASTLANGAAISARAPSLTNGPLIGDVVSDLQSTTGVPTISQVGFWGYNNPTVYYRLKSASTNCFSWTYASDSATGAGRLTAVNFPTAAACP